MFGRLGARCAVHRYVKAVPPSGAYGNTYGLCECNKQMLEDEVDVLCVHYSSVAISVALADLLVQL